MAGVAAPETDFVGKTLNFRPRAKARVSHSPPPVSHMGKKGGKPSAPRRASMVPTVAGTAFSVMK